MKILELLKDKGEELGEGVSSLLVKDLEARLGIRLPIDFRTYLLNYNYVEIFGDPIYGIHSDYSLINLYDRNKNTEHFNYGFMEVFSNDIDGTVYMRIDTGAIYLGFFEPAAKSFTAFIEKVTSE